MWIRYREHSVITEQQQVWQHRFGQEKYLFPRETGLCDIQNKRHIAELITMKDRYEVAYEKYGIHFNEDGIEIKKEQTSSLPQIRSTVSLSEATFAPKKMVSKAIIKMQESRNRNRIARGEKPIEFKS